MFLILALWRKRADPKRRRFNNIGLLVSSLYLLLTLGLKGITYYKFKSALEEQAISYEELETKPAPMQTILWTANVDAGDHFLIADYSLFDSQPITFHKHPKNHELIANLKEHPKLQRMIKIAKGWYTIKEKDGVLYFNDLRFGLLSTNPASQEYVFAFKMEEKNGELTFTENEKSPADAGSLLSDLWTRIKGN